MNRRLSLGALLVSMLVLFTTVASPALAAPRDEKKNHNKADGNDPDPEPEEYGPTTKGDQTCNDPGDGGRFDETCNASKQDDNPADGKHGNGGNGKCAGCSGKSDNQDPPGQSRNDHNNGYECDHNGGVGKGNPSHSRCLPDEENNPPRRRRPRPTPTPPPENPPIVNPAQIPSAPCDKDMNPANGIQECVLGVRLQGRPPQPPPAAAPAQLPFTGNESVGGYILLALALMTAGGVLLRIRLPEKTKE